MLSSEGFMCVSDGEFLREIFPSDAIDAVMGNGLKEHAQVSIRPHPYEFQLYDI